MKTRSTASPLLAPATCSFRSMSDPPKLLVLPEGRSTEACICTLAHPRTSEPSRYFFDPGKGVYQFIKVAAPPATYRSCLLARPTQCILQSAGVESESNSTDCSGLKTNAPDVLEDSKTSQVKRTDDKGERNVSAGYVTKKAELLVATPVDYLFLLLPAFANSPSVKSPSSKGLFLSADDILEKLFDCSKHFEEVTNHGSIREAIEERMQVVCDSVDAGDEKMYRLNENRLFDELVHKARNMVARGLPASMEERFIRKALESPVMGIKHEESSLSDTNAIKPNFTPCESIASDVAESQASTATSKSEDSVVSNVTEVTIPDDPIPQNDMSELYHLLRIRTALSYILSAYVPPTLVATMGALLKSPSSSINFKPLDEHLASLASMRAEALAARSLGDFSRKRSMYEEDEAVESRAEKKRRMEEEEKKKKASESRSIRDLKKVDTKGMKKMSDFFGKGVSSKKK